MLGDPGVRALEIELGLSDALAALPQERQACAVWAAHAWVRWMAEFGAEAAALDLEELDLVVEYTRTTTVDPWLVRWTAALAHCIRPDWAGGDRAGAARDLAAVARARRDEVSPLADLYLYSARGTESEQDAYRALQEARPDAPEEKAYITRALAAR